MRYESLIEPRGDTLTFHTASMGGAMRLAFVLFCAPPLAALFGLEAIGAGWVAAGILSGLLVLAFGGPWATRIGSYMAFERSSGFRPVNDDKVEPVAAGLLRFDAPAKPDRMRLRAGDSSPPIDVAARRLDLALGHPPSAAALAALVDETRQAVSAATAEPTLLFDGNVIDPFPLALAFDLAASTGLPLAWRSVRDDTHRLWTSRAASTPLVDRLGRCEPWPDGVPEDAVATPLHLRWRSPDLFVGALIASAPWFVTALVSGVGELHAVAVAMIVAGSMISLRSWRLDVVDGELRLGRWGSTSIALERVVEIVRVPERTEVLVAALAPTPHLALLDAGDRVAETTVALRQALASWAREQHRSGAREALRRSGDDTSAPRPTELRFLPSPQGFEHERTLLDGAPSLQLRARTLVLESRSGDRAEIHLEQPLRALLSRSRDLAGVPLLHLELRQRGATPAAAWQRLALSCRAEALGPAALEALPEQGLRADFVSLELMREVLAIVRGAMLALDGQERWL